MSQVSESSLTSTVMDTQKGLLVEKVAKTTMNSGIADITMHNLADELRVKQTQVQNQLLKDDDNLLMFLLDFETDINEFLAECAQNTERPETELKHLFKKFYTLFLQKPYYLDIIFDKNLKERDERVKNSLLRIRTIAVDYLTSVITNGKLDNTFKTQESTQVLVGKILSGFRLLMKDEHRIHEMILEMKTLKTSKE